MIKFYTTANLAEAYLLRDLLAADRIDSRIFNENAQGAVGEIPFTHTYPELWLVNEYDLPRARSLILEYENSIVDGKQKRCPSCGESNPMNFEVCWNCDRSL